MKIDRKTLALVIPIEREDGARIYVHSVPISMQIFETYYLVMAKAFASIYNEGLGVTAGPRVAALVLRRVAENMGVWEGEGGVRNGLMNEMRRLTNVVAPGQNGWETVPFHEAVKNGVIDEDEVSEVENALCFFSCAYRMHRKTEREPILEGASKLWGGQLESSDFTAFMRSLPTLMQGANTGEKTPETLSSVPC